MINKFAAIFFFLVSASAVQAQTVDPSAPPPLEMHPSPSPETTPLGVQQSITVIPKDTNVVVITMQSYSSYSAKTGGKVRYEVVQDVIVNGHVVAKAGDTAQGAIQEGQAGETGVFGIGFKGANLRLSVDEVYNFCGDTLHVDFDRSEYRRRQGAFGSKKDVQVDKGQKYVAQTDRVQRACSEASTATPAPIPSDALRSAAQ